MIKPTIGRVVLVYRPGRSTQFEPALITYVWSDTLINVAGFDAQGVSFSLEYLFLDQDIQVDPILVPNLNSIKAEVHFACWMPYQKAQAKCIQSSPPASFLELAAGARPSSTSSKNTK
jgi:hypothetical protein